MAHIYCFAEAIIMRYYDRRQSEGSLFVTFELISGHFLFIELSFLCVYRQALVFISCFRVFHSVSLFFITARHARNNAYTAPPSATYPSFASLILLVGGVDQTDDCYFQTACPSSILGHVRGGGGGGRGPRSGPQPQTDRLTILI